MNGDRVRHYLLAASLLLVGCAGGPHERSDAADFGSPHWVAQAWWEALASDDVDVAMSYMHANAGHTREALSKPHPPIENVRVASVELLGGGRSAECVVEFERHGVEQQTRTYLVFENGRWWITL